MRTSYGVLLLVACLGMELTPALRAEQKDPDLDSATIRGIGWDQWYNENYDNPQFRNPARRGKGNKIFSASYRRFLMKAAARERERWGAMIPANPSEDAAFLDPEAEKAALVGSTWTNIGPTKANVLQNGGTTLNVSDSGRINEIVTDPANPSTIYLCDSGGGVWKTTDGGTNWAPKTDSLGSLSCGDLAIDPNNSSVLYLGLGDPFDGTGTGLVKSTDGGTSWSAPVFLGASTEIPKMMVAPGNSSIVLAATNAGLFRSTNGGTSFSSVALATGQAGAPYVWDMAWGGGSTFTLTLEANPAATTGTTDGQVWWSSDNGATWTRATGFTKTSGVGRASIASAPSARTTMYAMAAVPNATSAADLADIFKSLDGGHTWTALGAASKRYSNRNRESANVNALLNGQGWYNHLTIVHPTNPNIVYFGGALLLAKTTDGGSTFSQISNWLAQFSLPYVHADFHGGTFDSLGNFYVGTDGGIFKSTDSGTTWSAALNVGITSHLIYSVGSTLASASAVVGGFQDNGTRVRSAATTIYDQRIGGDGFGSAIHRTNSSLVLGSLYYDRVMKSTNGGTSFSTACTGITECGNSASAPFNTGIVTWDGSATGDTVFTWSNVKVYRSTNFAGSWTALGTTGLPTTAFNIRGFGVAFSNQNTMGLVANSGRVYISTNGGTSWTLATTPTNNGLSLSSIWFDEVNPSLIYVASVAPDSTKNHLWKSSDLGANWITIDGNGFPFGIPVNKVRTDPGNNQTLYASTHLGAYRSVDAGANWVRFGTGLPLVNVTDFYISSSSTLARVSTFGRGFWELLP
ncbi:MAG TPA: hypothetical protein VKK31_11200 [Thermoanaerobaculia bacterium]|nr:hypothetical protein [Thermoanaerobaculia bacterium]